MKTFLEKTKSVYAAGKKKVNALVYGGMFAATTAIANVAGFALPDDINAETLVNNIVLEIVKVFRYIGILLLAWSIGQLVLAFKNEDGDSKSRAMMMLVVSVLLIGIKTLLTSIGLITAA